MIAKEAAQTAEDSRLIAIKRMEEERLAKERQAAAERELLAKNQADTARAQADTARSQAETARLEADAEARRRQLAEQAQLQAQQAAAQADRDRASAEAAKSAAQAATTAAQADADRIRREAEAARAAAQAETAQLQQQAALERANLEAARAAAQSEAEKARLAAEESNRLREQSEQEKLALREQIRTQLNLILETRSTARGLIVNMSDVLFDTAKFTLRAGAREKLAKISGIISAHPGLKMEIEGHTDSVGGEEYNQKLSEQRASSVRDYLVQQGISTTMITSKGFGKTQPVASNDSAAGRQQNRRVELVVSGDQIGNPATSSGLITKP